MISKNMNNMSKNNNSNWQYNYLENSISAYIKQIENIIKNCKKKTH